MASRTVRLDERTERLLKEVIAATGMSVSAVLKVGLAALDQQLKHRPRRSAWEIYQTLDLGPGGYAIAPARDAQHAVAKAIRRQHHEERRAGGRASS